VFLISNHFSRRFEEDADSYAFHALAQQDIDPIAFVHAMQALQRAHPELKGGKGLRYVSNHPLNEERIARATQASHAFQASHPQAKPSPGS
jgi:predicted Zn-dependent protease